MMRYGPGVALLVVDVQNDFMDPRGTLAVAGATSIIPVINREIALARANGSLVACSQDWHPSRTPHFARDGGKWPAHCVRDTWGAEFYPTVEIPVGIAVIRKGTNGEDGYSAFTMRDADTGAMVPTPLGMLFHEAGIESVVVVGVATDYCVKASALDAIGLGYSTTVLTDAVAAVNVAPGDGDRALEELETAGVTLARTDTR
jgi:nicotinamidase/pyrazinamidase